MALFEQISSDILAAMKAKDAVRRDTLRNVKKYFLEAKTAPGANDELTDDALLLADALHECLALLVVNVHRLALQLNE